MPAEFGNLNLKTLEGVRVFYFLKNVYILVQYGPLSTATPFLYRLEHFVQNWFHQDPSVSPHGETAYKQTNIMQ